MALYEVVQEFVLFLGQYAPGLDESFSQIHLVEDKSVFKALGPVWHQSDHQALRLRPFSNSYAYPSVTLRMYWRCSKVFIYST